MSCCNICWTEAAITFEVRQALQMFQTQMAHDNPRKRSQGSLGFGHLSADCVCFQQYYMLLNVLGWFKRIWDLNEKKSYAVNKIIMSKAYALCSLFVKCTLIDMEGDLWALFQQTATLKTV